MPRQRGPEPEQEPASSGPLTVFPHELRPGDRVTVNGQEWEVAAPPAVYLQGKMHTIRLHKPGDPSVTSVEHMAAHERVAMWRREVKGDCDERQCP